MLNNSVTILAAGKGTRLGMPFPKPLTPLADGKTIMERQLEAIKSTFGGITVNTVVGFQHEKITSAFPDERYHINDRFEHTNTSKSLLIALETSPEDHGMLWFNGDVVFDARLLSPIAALIAEDQSFVSVNTSSVGDEEVKYTVCEQGFINQLSKVVPTHEARGEAVGINFVSAQDKQALIESLRVVDDQDYFERGIELAIQHSENRYLPFDISGYGFGAMEVDFAGDLENANRALRAAS